MLTKICSKCGLAKDRKDFNKDSRSKSGIRCLCRDCQKKENVTYRSSYNGIIRRAFHVAKSRAKKYGVVDDLTFEQLRDIFDFFDGIYAYCDQKLEDTPSVDHIIPFSKNGTNTASNIVICCQRCNTVKSNSSVVEFACNNVEHIITYTECMSGLPREGVRDMFNRGVM